MDTLLHFIYTIIESLHYNNNDNNNSRRVIFSQPSNSYVSYSHLLLQAYWRSKITGLPAFPILVLKDYIS